MYKIELETLKKINKQLKQLEILLSASHLGGKLKSSEVNSTLQDSEELRKMIDDNYIHIK